MTEAKEVMDKDRKNKEQDTNRKRLESKFEIFSKDWINENCKAIHNSIADLFPYQELCAQIHLRYEVANLGELKLPDGMKKETSDKLAKSQLTSFVKDWVHRSVKHPAKAKTAFPSQLYVEAIFKKFDVGIRVDE